MSPGKTIQYWEKEVMIPPRDGRVNGQLLNSSRTSSQKIGSNAAFKRYGKRIKKNPYF